jgi:hypothetical protein
MAALGEHRLYVCLSRVYKIIRDLQAPNTTIYTGEWKNSCGFNP